MSLHCHMFIIIFFQNPTAYWLSKEEHISCKENIKKREQNVMEVYCKSIVDTKDLIKQQEEIIEEQETIIAK